MAPNNVPGEIHVLGVTRVGRNIGGSSLEGKSSVRPVQGCQEVTEDSGVGHPSQAFFHMRSLEAILEPP